jgi:2-polyprenyl-3-methyl-5-hydroxy-6-metoxy-1,4-benzoquinol methylase
MTEMRLGSAIDLTGRRVEQEELLDLGLGTGQDVTENLSEMQRINDVFGGTRALTRHLLPRLLMHNEPVRLLDLGTGGAGLPLALARWAHRVNLPLHVLAVDWSMRNLSVAAQATGQEPEITLVQADALCLPLGLEQVDYVISSLFMHHLPPEQLTWVLQESFDLARSAVIMSDLVRGWLPYLAYQFVQPVFARNFLTRHDGALSIRRAYTPEELKRLTLQAGLMDSRVYRHFPWRMTLVVQK